MLLQIRKRHEAAIPSLKQHWNIEEIFSNHHWHHEKSHGIFRCRFSPWKMFAENPHLEHGLIGFLTASRTTHPPEVKGHSLLWKENQGNCCLKLFEYTTIIYYSSNLHKCTEEKAQEQHSSLSSPLSTHNKKQQKTHFLNLEHPQTIHKSATWGLTG